MLYCSGFLYILWGMHLIWWWKIVRVMVNGCRGKSLPDARHDGFGEEKKQEARKPKKEE